MIQIDDLWDKVIDFIYDRGTYVKDLERFLSARHITRNDLIVDVCAGSGFPSLDLVEIGYTVQALDGSSRMVELFNRNAQQMGIDGKSRLVRWSELPGDYEGKAWVLLCRGNSLIYAGGSWGEKDIEFDAIAAKDALQKTLERFYGCIKKGGFLYVDKFNKDEIPREVKKGFVEVDGKNEQLLWKVEHDLDRRLRTWTLIRESATGERLCYPNKGYFLMYEELRGMLLKAGFGSVEEVRLESEKNFTVMIAYKS